MSITESGIIAVIGKKSGGKRAFRLLVSDTTRDLFGFNSDHIRIALRSISVEEFKEAFIRDVTGGIEILRSMKRVSSK